MAMAVRADNRERRDGKLIMLLSHPFSTKSQVQHSDGHDGLNHLLSAAVVSRQFREMLLEDPEAALRKGYLGEQFELSHEEREHLTSTRAQSLADLARSFNNA
jgi:hypothetical protein